MPPPSLFKLDSHISITSRRFDASTIVVVHCEAASMTAAVVDWQWFQRVDCLSVSLPQMTKTKKLGRQDRGYNYVDLLDLCPEKVDNYGQKLKNFYTEHIHGEEEIRYCLQGSGYFDVRDKEDHWIRIAMKASDLIVLPAGIYHRFTFDTNNYIKDDGVALSEAQKN